MRRKRHKATRRALRFFRINHGFREPYKVRRWREGERERSHASEKKAIEMLKRKNHSFSPHAAFSRFSIPLPNPAQVLLDGNFVHALRETK